MEGSMLSPADVAVLSGNRGNNGGYGFGDGNGWWIILLFLAFGWGNNGGGLFGGGSNGINPNYVTSSDSAFLSRQIDSDTAGIERKLDYVQEQICNSDQMNSQMFANINTNLLTNAATLNNTLATNFATTNSNLMNGFAGVNQGISANRYENQLAMNTIGSQLQNCCCEARIQGLENTNALQTSLAGINYNMAMNNNGVITAINDGFCNTNYANANIARDIIENSNSNFRQLHDEIVANRMADKDETIAQLRTQLNNANLAASQARQTGVIDDKIDALGNRLQPVARPAYIVANPYCNCNNGCGCGNFNF